MCSKEEIIAHYLADNFEIEQMRYNMFLPNDIYHSVPKLIFRFSKNYGDEIYLNLKDCVEKFNGKLKWTIYPSFVSKKVINYLMAPKAEHEREKSNFEGQKFISEREYFSEEAYRNLCDDAIGDIEGLCLYLKNNFYH